METEQENLLPFFVVPWLLKKECGWTNMADSMGPVTTNFITWPGCSTNRKSAANTVIRHKQTFCCVCQRGIKIHTEKQKIKNDLHSRKMFKRCKHSSWRTNPFFWRKMSPVDPRVKPFRRACSGLALRLTKIRRRYKSLSSWLPQQQYSLQSVEPMHHFQALFSLLIFQNYKPITILTNWHWFYRYCLSLQLEVSLWQPHFNCFVRCRRWCTVLLATNILDHIYTGSRAPDHFIFI